MEANENDPQQIQVLITLPFSEESVEALRSISPRLNVRVHPAEAVDEIPDGTWKQANILYTNRVIPTREVAPGLAWIQFHWAGIDDLLDEPILQDPDLVATTLSGASASQMAEYVLTMLLALGHHLPTLMGFQREATWPEKDKGRLAPRELRGSTVGIVGYGSVGRQVANLLHTFGATVLATQRNVKHPEDTGYMPEGLGDPGGDLARRLYPPQALRAMLKECHFVVVCVPLTAETRNLIDAETLAAVPPEAYLIDVSRGGVVDHEALVEALETDALAGAALDVFPEEPLPEDSPLWGLPNVIITPHIAGISRRYDRRAVALFEENLERYLAGEPLLNQYVPQRGY